MSLRCLWRVVVMMRLAAAHLVLPIARLSCLLLLLALLVLAGVPEDLGSHCIHDGVVVDGLALQVRTRGRNSGRWRNVVVLWSDGWWYMRLIVDHGDRRRLG